MSEDIVINSAGWMPMARDLMKAKRSFTVEGWDYSFDAKEGEALAKEFGYTLMIQPDNRKAFFAPKGAGQRR